MTTKKLITSDDPKGLDATAKWRAVYNKQQLTDGADGSAQRLNESREFWKELAELIQKHSATNQYANEVVSSNYTYPKEYKGPKPIAEQVQTIATMFGLDPTQALEFAKNLPTLPEGAEGWFAIPRWEKVAPTYGQAVQKVLDLIKQTRNGAFYNYREGELGPNQLRQSTKQVAMFQKLGDEQKDQDILVVPAQFGIRHRGRSVRRAREVMNANEVGLGAFAIGIMLLTHPERLQHYDDLWIDCAGDEFASIADGDFSRSPFFSFSDYRVGFGASDVGSARDFSGSASVCLPQD